MRFPCSAYQRYILQNVLSSLADTPAVFIRGPRQAGKTTFVQQISAEYYPATYVTLDDLTVLSAVTRDPVAFVKSTPKPVIVDEVQRAPMRFPLERICWPCRSRPSGIPDTL
ncbi:MAG: AAA family ATPase [Deltaproteobacteria bacterium]|nr:AAA family ATPase [Deltaproteobacteria bacterium]